MRRSLFLILVSVASVSSPARAQQNTFDLAGPTIALSVTRGGSTLPIARVPSLQSGDRLAAQADLPVEKSARYLLVIGFLRGAVTPPPKKWFFQAKTWQRSKKPFIVTIPEGAEQAIALLVPKAGGGFDAVVDAVRERPGAFVRASQDLHQASLDRARLEAFVAGIARIEEHEPERLDRASPVLANALAIRLNPECLSRQRALRAACLTQNHESLVLQTSTNSPTVGDRLIGAPTDVAYRIASTREGGAGFYSPYIGLARDLVRLFGAFRSTPYQYLPALAVGKDDALQLRLNTPPSFAAPRSVLVTALPSVGAAPRPTWRVGGKGGVCLARPGFVLPVENAPLLYATGYASDLSLRVKLADGRILNLPVAANAERGGLVLDETKTAAAGGAIVSASLRGRWGFDQVDEPLIIAGRTGAADWGPRPTAAVVVGRDHPLVLRGGASACVDGLVLQSGSGEQRPLEWKATGPDEITVTLPLTRVRPGPLTLLVNQAGIGSVAVKLTAQSEPSRLDALTLHAGDTDAVLTGARLDQVAEVQIGTARFTPGELIRGGKGDQLALSSGEMRASVAPGNSGEGVVRLRDGRTEKVQMRVVPPRPAVALISRNVEARSQPGGFVFRLPEGTMQPEEMLTFSFRTTTGPLQPEDVIEIGTADGSARAKLSLASADLQRVAGDVAIATIRPTAALGTSAAGPLRFRLLRKEVAGDWIPLVEVVRLPELGEVSCSTAGSQCSLTGRRLFLIASIADSADFADPVTVPVGFIGSSVSIPRPRGPQLYLRLRDAPTALVQVEPIVRDQNAVAAPVR
ncbi:hypothetical protein [uncultured Sphingomonas sp.]|uniref:hypothetical protein n=1 Tax=uncultured Sphingomonas sp. TaxID=158754 RepID=UPI0035CB8AC2